MRIFRTLYIYVSKSVRITVCFSKPKGVREQKRLGDSGLNDLLFGVTEIFQKRLAVLE